MEIALYILSLVGSGVGFMTQMLVSGYWTTAFSQDIFYFSINLATYFLALGLGSLLSARIEKPQLRHLGAILLALIFVSGGAIPFLRLGIKYFGNVVLFPILVVMTAGLLNGIVIPLTLKIGEGYSRISLGLLFFIDYGAAALFAFVFTFVLLIPFGYSKTALALSIVSVVVVALTLACQRELKTLNLGWAILVFLFPPFFYFLSGAHETPNRDRNGLVSMVHNEQSHYQKIVLTEEKVIESEGSSSVHHVLYLDGFLQFSSDTEQNYHMCLADIPMIAANVQKRDAKNILILGGGDGLAARNFLKNPSIKKITLVELDPSMIRLAKENPIVRGYNLNSLSHSKVEVIVADAFRWVQENRKNKKQSYDLIIIDFPAPKNLTLARLFSAEFYRSTFELLAPNGFVSIQAGPSYSQEDLTGMTLSKVTTSILKTIESIGYRAFPYVITQDSEAFVLTTEDPRFSMEEFTRKMGFYAGGILSPWCQYNKLWKRPEAEKNTLNTLKLSRYMIDWFQRAQNEFFYYRGNSLVFLPQ